MVFLTSFTCMLIRLIAVLLLLPVVAGRSPRVKCVDIDNDGKADYYVLLEPQAQARTTPVTSLTFILVSLIRDASEQEYTYTYFSQPDLELRL